MRKRKALALAIVCLVALVALATMLAHDREPSYHGRSLSDWLSLPPQLDYPDDTKLSPAAHQAICSIGTNAIPVALYWISYEPSTLTVNLLQLMRNFAPAIGGTVFMARADHFAFQAENVFAILASEARPAIPELTRLAIASRYETRVWRCARALADIGPEGVSGLTAILSDPSCKARWVAALTTSTLGTNAAPAIPFLLRSVTDKDERLACAASITLGEIGLSPNTVVPALTNALQCTNSNRRAAAITGLGGFGVAAKSAAPQLLRALGDPAQIVREQATNALLRIAPDTVTNTLAQ